MSYEAVAGVVLVAWVLIGVVLGIVMDRRGYSGFGWGVVGAVLGPVAVIAALLMRLPPKAPEVVEAGWVGRGPVDVLVGIDGSAESLAAASGAQALFGPRLGRLTLAAVVPFDATPDEEAHAYRRLEAAVHTVRVVGAGSHVDPEAVILRGVPAEALRDFARERSYAAIAVAPHGRGASKAILGSTSASLIRSSPVPVMVGAPEAAAGNTAPGAPGNEALAS